jgi:hypothetical protein
MRATHAEFMADPKAWMEKVREGGESLEIVDEDGVVRLEFSRSAALDGLEDMCICFGFGVIDPECPEHGADSAALHGGQE